MTVVVSRLDELDRHIELSGREKWVFRGQGNANWGLIPSMFRGLESSSLDGWETQINERERDIFREFSDRSRRYRPPLSNWDLLVCAQHYGVPTRLLDWTTNYNCALYFAAASSPGEDGALWSSLPARLAMPYGIGRIHNGVGYRKERLARYIPERNLPFAMPYSDPVPQFDGVRVPAAPAGTNRQFSQSGISDRSGILVFFLPEDSNDRVARQNGLFSVYLSESSEDLVIDHARYLRSVERHIGNTILEKIVIPADAKPSLLHSLERVGVDARTVYPDLTGLGIYLTGWQRELVEEVT